MTNSAYTTIGGPTSPRMSSGAAAGSAGATHSARWMLRHPPSHVLALVGVAVTITGAAVASIVTSGRSSTHNTQHRAPMLGFGNARLRRHPADHAAAEVSHAKHKAKSAIHGSSSERNEEDDYRLHGKPKSEWNEEDAYAAKKKAGVPLNEEDRYIREDHKHKASKHVSSSHERNEEDDYADGKRKSEWNEEDAYAHGKHNVEVNEEDRYAAARKAGKLVNEEDRYIDERDAKKSQHSKHEWNEEDDYAHGKPRSEWNEEDNYAALRSDGREVNEEERYKDQKKNEEDGHHDVSAHTEEEHKELNEEDRYKDEKKNEEDITINLVSDSHLQSHGEDHHEREVEYDSHGEDHHEGHGEDHHEG